LLVGSFDFLYRLAHPLIEGGSMRRDGPASLLSPSTARENPRGIFVHGAQLTATDDVPAGCVRLGRPWHTGGKPDAIGQGIVCACTIGSHVVAEPWVDMVSFAWEHGRLDEHGTDW